MAARVGARGGARAVVRLPARVLKPHGRRPGDGVPGRAHHLRDAAADGAARGARPVGGAHADQHRRRAAARPHPAPAARRSRGPPVLDVRADRVHAGLVPRPRPARRQDHVGRAGPCPTPRSTSSTTTGDRLPPGETGELVVRGASVMRGYWGKPEATAAAPARRRDRGREGAAHRRPVPHRRRGLPLLRGPHRRRVQVQGREGQPQGDRARPLRARGRGRGRGRRRARRDRRHRGQGRRRACGRAPR